MENQNSRPRYNTRDYEAERTGILMKIAALCEGLDTARYNPCEGGHVFFSGWDCKLHLTSSFGELNFRDALAAQVLIHRLLMDTDITQYEFIQGEVGWSFCATTDDPIDIVTFGDGPSPEYALADAFVNYFEAERGETQS